MKISTLEPAGLEPEIFCTTDLSPIHNLRSYLCNWIGLNNVTVSKTYDVDRVEESNICTIFVENQNVNVNTNVEIGLHKCVVGT
jgi:hypothetical protein